jgi:hypothetical protein
LNDADNNGDKVDDTERKRKRRSNACSSSNKKIRTHSSPKAGASSSTAQILQQLESNANASKYFELNRLLVKQISEQSAIEGQIQNATRFVWETRRELMADGIQREDVFEHPMYNEALESVNVLKARRTELVEMVEKTKGDIAEIDAEQLAVPTSKAGLSLLMMLMGQWPAIRMRIIKWMQLMNRMILMMEMTSMWILPMTGIRR